MWCVEYINMNDRTAATKMDNSASEANPTHEVLMKTILGGGLWLVEQGMTLFRISVVKVEMKA